MLTNTDIYADSRFESYSYREMADNVERACEWLTAHGLPISATRIGHYRQCLSTLGDYYDRGALDKVEGAVDFPTMANSV